MPFRHVAMFRWAEHVDDGHVDRIRESFDELASLAPGLRHHAHGTDVGVSEGTFDYLVVADFDTIADWRAYRDHPVHLVLVAELIDGYVTTRATGQYQVPDARSAHDVSAARMRALLAEPDDDATTESDDELLARARRAADADMQALLSDPDDAT